MNVTEQLTPERWLLAIGQQPVRDPIDAELKALAAPGEQPTFARWRLQHGLVRFIGPDELGPALRQALDEGCPAVHLHSTLPETDLQDALSTARLRGGEERRLELRVWAPDSEALPSALRTELARPDGWVEVAWRLNNGASFPVLAAPGHPGSEAAYGDAFRAWRRERLREGDSGTSPFAIDGIEPEDDDTIDELAGATGTCMPDSTDDDAPDLAQWMVGFPAGRRPDTTGVRPAIPGMMHAADEEKAGWVDVTTWTSRTLAPEGGHWGFTVRLQRLPFGENMPWGAARVQVEWAPEVAAKAFRHRFRICLLPRLQQPVLLTLDAGKSEVTVKGVPASRLQGWPEALEGTPLTVLVLP
jgi:hypothetical protein